MSTWWTTERMETARKMWVGGASGAEIKRAMGAASRNMVIAKLNRMGMLGTRQKPAAPALKVKPKAAPKPAKAQPAFAPSVKVQHHPPSVVAGLHTVAQPLPLSRQLRIMDPGFRGCRWPLEGPMDVTSAETRFCCAPGFPYCATHAARAYWRTAVVASPPSKRRA